MTHPDTLIPRAVVEQALEETRASAKDVFRGSCSSAFEAIEFTIEEAKATIRAALERIREGKEST